LADFSDIVYASHYARIFLILRQPLARPEPWRRQGPAVQRERKQASDIVSEVL
jgi:hypothetical protein